MVPTSGFFEYFSWDQEVGRLILKDLELTLAEKLTSIRHGDRMLFFRAAVEKPLRVPEILTLFVPEILAA